MHLGRDPLPLLQVQTAVLLVPSQEHQLLHCAAWTLMHLSEGLPSLLQAPAVPLLVPAQERQLAQPPLFPCQLDPLVTPLRSA